MAAQTFVLGLINHTHPAAAQVSPARDNAKSFSRKVKKNQPRQRNTYVAPTNQVNALRRCRARM